MSIKLGTDRAWAVFRDDGEKVSAWFDTFEGAGALWWRLYDHAEYEVREYSGVRCD